MNVTVTEKILFPLSTKYDKGWIMNNSLGENVLYNLESLCDRLEFKRGMKVLDLGCGKAVSAIFLAKEYGVQVWALDPKINPSDNYQRAVQMGCEDKVFPLKLNARDLPFPENFFDVIIAVDSYMYYGNDAKFAQYITKFLKPQGFLGIVDICYREELNYLDELTGFMKAEFKDNWYFVHSLEWWKKMWDDTGKLQIAAAEIVPENNFIKSEYIKGSVEAGCKDLIAEELSEDKNNLINVFRMVAQKISV